MTFEERELLLVEDLEHAAWRYDQTDDFTPKAMAMELLRLAAEARALHNERKSES